MATEQVSEREVLFRGKRVDNGEWAYGDLLHCDDEAEIYSESVGKNGGYVILETVGQYTGLTDKNGTRIFEGDIVEYEGERYSINYLTRYARFSAVKPKTVFCVFAYQCGEVIGNIHDNPELLKGE